MVAPRGNAKTVVVVPKTRSEEWRGYAFAEQVNKSNFLVQLIDHLTNCFIGAQP